MAKKCKSLFDKNFGERLELPTMFIKECILNNINTFNIKILDIIKDWANEKKIDLSSITDKDIESIDIWIRRSLPSNLYALNIIQTSIQNIITFLKDPNFESKYIKLKNPNNQEEAITASSFISDKLGLGINSLNFQQEVQNELFKCIIWNRDEDNFVSSITDIHQNIQKYIKNLKSSLTNPNAQNAFLKIISDPNINLAEAFDENNTLIFNPATCTLKEFKTLFTINYLDYFIQKDFQGYLDIDPEKFNDFSELALEHKYAPASKIATHSFDNEEYIDLSKNTESLVKLFITNFPLYDYKSLQPLGINFQLNTWHEANTALKAFIPVIEEQGLKLSTAEIDSQGNQGDSYISILKEKFKSNADQIILNNLEQIQDDFYLSDFITRLSDHPDFYLKYFLYCILYKNGQINPQNLVNYIDSNSNILYNKNKFNFIYSLYENLFGEQNSILASENKIITTLIDSPKFLSSLTQNLLTDSDMGILEFDTTKNKLIQTDIKDSSSQQQRRELEERITIQNIVEDTDVSFQDWMSSLPITESALEELREENGELTFTLKFANKNGTDDVVFSTKQELNQVNSEDLTKLKENENFLKFIRTLLGLEVTTKASLAEALFISPENIQDIKTLCIGAMTSQYLQRTPNPNILTSVKLKDNSFFGTKSAVTEAELKLSLPRIANIVASLKESFSASVMDAGKNLIGTASEGNIGSSPRQYISRSRLQKSPSSHFSIFNNTSGFETKTIRDIKLPNGTSQLWKNTSFSEMFTFTFLTEFIGGFSEPEPYSYSSTNGKKIGCPVSVNSDKTAFYQNFINTYAKIFNNLDIKAATSKDIQTQYFKDFQNFYSAVLSQLISKLTKDYNKLSEFYKDDEATLNFIKQNYIYNENLSNSDKINALVSFYKNLNQEIINYNLSRERTSSIIEVTDVFQQNVNELFKTEVNKFNSKADFDFAIKLGNLSFVHTLMKKGTIIPFASVENNDPQSTLTELLGNNKYNFDLVSFPEGTTIPAGYQKIEIENSFYPKGKTYYIKTSREVQDINYFTQYGKSSTFMPLFNISFEDVIKEEGKPDVSITRYFTIATKQDFNNFLKAYKKAGHDITGFKNHPFKLAKKGLNVVINPLLEKYNSFAVMMSQEYLTSEVGVNIAHPTKGAPSFSDFQKVYQNDGFGEKELKAMYHEVLIGYCDKAQQKRNTNLTAQMKRLNRDVLTGIDSKIKVALISDPKTLGFSPNGSTGDIKTLDGATFQTYTCAKALNESLCASKVSLETMKLYNTIYIDDFGIGSNNKTANFTITNEKMRKDEFYQRMFFNMTKLPWRTSTGAIFQPKDIFTNDITGNTLLTDKLPFYYKVDGQWYARYYEGFAKDANGNTIYDEGNPVYQFRDYLCDEAANINDDDEGSSVQLTFTDNYEIFLALGAWNSGELKNGKLIYSNWSLDKLFEIQCYNIEEGDVSNKHYKYKCEVFQPLLASDIYMSITEGAIKMTHINKNPSSVMEENTSNLKSSIYNYFEQDTENLGAQLDKNHHADDSKTSNATQVISACASQGYTPTQAISVYNGLASFSKINTKLFRTTDLIEITGDDSQIEEALYQTVVDFVKKNKEQEQDSLLDYLTRDFIKKLKDNPNIKFKELSKDLPIDSTSIYKKVHSIISSTLTKAGIKLKVNGTLSVINPTQPAVKYYRVPTVRPLSLNQEWINNFQQKVQEKGSAIEAYKELMGINYFSWEYVRSDKLPGFRTENSTISSKEKFLDNILYALSEEVLTPQDIKIGNNYEFYFDEEADKQEFLNLIKEDLGEYPISKLQDKDKPKQLWANVGLPHLTIYEGRDNFIGSHLVKQWMRRFPKLRVKQIFNKGNDLDFQNVSFKTLSGKSYELTDLFTSQLQFRLTGEKDLDQRLNLYFKLKENYTTDFINYIKSYFYYQPNYNKENYKEITVITDALLEYIEKAENFTKIDNFILESCKTQYSQLPEKINENETEEDLQLRLEKKQIAIKDKIKETLIEACSNFLYKKHQDDLHCLSLFGDNAPTHRIVKIVSEYDGPTTTPSEYPKAKINIIEEEIDPQSINCKTNGLIMPKTFRSVLGLDDDTTVGEILNDKQYFVKKLIQKDICKLHNIELSWNKDLKRPFIYRAWDLCLKKNNGKHLYIKMMDDNTTKSIVQNKEQFIEAYKIIKDAEGKFWAVHNKTGKVIYQVFSENDRVFYNALTGSDVILTQKGAIEKENKIVHFQDENNIALTKDHTIKSNPFEFYLNTYTFNTFAVNTEEADSNITENSLTWILLDNAFKNVPEIGNILPESFQDKMQVFEEMRDNKGNLPKGELGTYIRKQGKLLWQSFNKILNVIAARIPAQSLQSVMPMRVADFIETDSNNALVSAYQFYLQGSDLDIDTVTIQTFALNDAGIFQTHTPYYNLDFDIASSLLPFKPEIRKVVLSGEEGDIKLSQIIADYGIEIQELKSADAKASFYKFLEDKLTTNITTGEKEIIEKLLKEMKNLQTILVEAIENSEDPNSNNITYNGFTYQVYKEGKDHAAADAKISRLKLYKTYLNNIYDFQTLSTLQNYEDEYIYQGKDVNKKIFFISNDKVYFKLDSTERIKLFTNLINQFKQGSIQTSSNINEKVAKQICNYISRHFEYFHKLSKKNQQVAVANFETNNVYNITVDPSHISEAFASIDVIVSPVKKEADKQIQATEGWYSIITNSANIPAGIEINMVGKDGIAICAVAEKHYFALMGALQIIMEGNDEELKRTLIAGLPSFIQNGEQIEVKANPNFNGKIANKKCNILCNAFSNKVAKVGSDKVYSLEFTPENINDIDSLLATLIEQQKYNRDAALIISALLSLATDNAKELVLGKINAGLSTIDLYLAGATTGLNINELMTIINSSYGQEITKMTTSNIFTGQTKFNTLDAVKNFERVGAIINRMFGKQKLFFPGLKHQPLEVINFLLAKTLFLKAKKDVFVTETSQEDVEIDLKENTQTDIETQNTETEVEIIAEPDIHQEKDSWFLTTYKGSIPIKTKIKDFNSWIYDPIYAYRNCLYKANPNVDIKTIYFDAINAVKRIYVKSIVGYTKSENINKESEGRSTRAYTEQNKNQIKLQKDQILNAYLERLEGCLYKYFNNFAGNIIQGNYLIPNAFDKLALIANEFSRGSRLLINKEIPTDTAKKENMINNFEQVFVEQLKTLTSKNHKKIKEIFAKNPDDYIVFKKAESNDQIIIKDQTFTGAKLNLYRFLYDKEYQKNCILLMDKLKVYHNILNAVCQLPHYKEYLGTLVASIKTDDCTLTKIINTEFVNPKIEEWKVKAQKYKKEIYQKSQALTENLMIQQFFKNKALNATLTSDQAITFGFYDNNEVIQNNLQSLIIDFSTNVGKENFIRYMNYLFEFLTSNKILENNKFISSLKRAPIIHTLNGNKIFAWTVEADLNSKDVTDRKLAEEIQNYYLSLNQTTLSQITDIVKDKNLSDNFIELKFNTNNDINLADLIYMYGLLVTNNQISKTSIINIVNKQISRPGSIAEEYFKFYATTANNLITAYKYCKDPKTGNIDRDKLQKTDVEEFLSTLRSHEELITPILFQDTIEAGTHVRLKNKTLIEYYDKMITKIKDTVGPDDIYFDYDEGFEFDMSEFDYVEGEEGLIKELKTYPIASRARKSEDFKTDSIYNKYMAGYAFKNLKDLKIRFDGDLLTITTENDKIVINNKINKDNIDSYIDAIKKLFPDSSENKLQILKENLPNANLLGYCLFYAIFNGDLSLSDNSDLTIETLKGIRCD